MRNDWDIVDPTHETALFDRFHLAAWPTQAIRVGIVEDHALSALSLQLVLESIPGVEVVMQASNGQQGIEAVSSVQPDVVFMDIGMPVMDGVECSRLLKRWSPNTKIIAFTSRTTTHDVFDALQAGADAFVVKGCELSGIKKAIDSVMANQRWIDPAVEEASLVRKIG